MGEQSITHWIDGLKQGDQEAAERLWQDYFSRMTRLAASKLRSSAKRIADEEDVAISAFNSFCNGAAQGRFPRLDDRDDLWRLLFTITERKSLKALQYERRQKRGGGKVRGESVFANSQASTGGIAQHETCPELRPDDAYEIAENVELLLNSLQDDILQRIALAKMEGFTNLEIADMVDCSERSVKRKLKVIRTMWLEQAS